MKRFLPPLRGFCLTLGLATASAGEWPQWRGPDRAATWVEEGIMEQFPPDGLKAKWRVDCGPGYSSPVVAGGRVFLTESVPVRSQAAERVRCFDAATGREIWRRDDALADFPEWAYDYYRSDDPKRPATLSEAGVAIGFAPSATPAVDGYHLYTLGRAGRLFCLDAATGALHWEKDLPREYQFTALSWPGSPSPLIDGRLLIVFIGGKSDADLVAFDKISGTEIWRALGEGATHSSPAVFDILGGGRQLIVWTKQSVTALDPSDGRVLWRERLLTSGDYAVATPIFDGRSRLLVGGLMLGYDWKNAAPSILWPEAKAVSRRVLSNTSTAMFEGGHVYSARSKGQFVCLDAATGKEIWVDERLTALQNFASGGASVHLTRQGGSMLLYNDRGELIRARLSQAGCEIVSRTAIATPVNPYGGMKLAWPPPAIAEGCVFARTDEEIVCVSLRQ